MELKLVIILALFNIRSESIPYENYMKNGFYAKELKNILIIKDEKIRKITIELPNLTENHSRMLEINWRKIFCMPEYQKLNYV